jgi:hypothetical protein
MDTIDGNRYLISAGEDGTAVYAMNPPAWPGRRHRYGPVAVLTSTGPSRRNANAIRTPPCLRGAHPFSDRPRRATR